MKNEQKFYDALQNIFVGAPIEGEGGYVNLLKIKERYYSTVISAFKQEVEQDDVITSTFKEDFYDMLFSFFDRYFSECGSVYFAKTANWQRVYERVYSKDKDVALFWKTHMLYYVKSDILFQSIYVKAADEDGLNYVFYFDVGELQNKQNNEKKELVFEYVGSKTECVKDFHDDSSGDKTFCFSVKYSERGRKTKIKATSTQTGIPGDVIEKAIKVFKKQTSVDFFINKNAGRFLEEQLELFLHQYLLNDESIFSQERLSQIKAVQKYAKKLITFISQFEDELVRIWNKPKFVRKSNYVITIDRLPKQLIEKLRNSAGLAQQIQEWKNLLLVEDNFGFSDEDLINHQHLPIDTKYFKELEIEIISLFDNLEEALDGRLIHSENYQALNTIKTRYKQQIQTIYIDPPFNTGTDFIFLDKFQDSTWLNIIDERLCLAQKFLCEGGSLYMELDHIAEHYGKILLDNHFGTCNYMGKITWNTGNNISGFKSQANYWIRQADYIHFYVNRQDSTAYKFTKVYESLDSKPLNIGWLDLLSTEKKKFYIERWNNGVLQQIPVSTKAKAKGTIWNDIYSFQYSEPRITESISFASNQKPENLLRRIIQSSTAQRDIVLDFFLGSGTTVAVAQKLNRKWVGIEMGEYFSEFYEDTLTVNNNLEDNEEESEKKDLSKNLDPRCIIDTISVCKKTTTYLVKKIGVLGRLKNVLNGDKTFSSITSLVIRKPHLSNDINWQGGGFFKYYDLEQYEDTLSKAKYFPDKGEPYSDNVFEQYVFFADEKLADVLSNIDNEVSLDFTKLYDDIDFPETISLLLGKAIKRIDENFVELADIKEPIKYNVTAMNKEEKIAFFRMLKPLLWWGE